MDILRAVSSPNLDIRRKTLDVVLDLVTVNIDEVVPRSEGDTESRRTQEGGEYRQMLVQAVHQCAVKFPETAGIVLPTVGFLGANSARRLTSPCSSGSADQRGLGDDILQRRSRLVLPSSSRVCGTCLWIVGEYALTPAQVEERSRHSRHPRPTRLFRATDRDDEELRGAATRRRRLRPGPQGSGTPRSRTIPT